MTSWIPRRRYSQGGVSTQRSWGHEAIPPGPASSSRAVWRSVQSWIDDGRGDLTLNGPVGATSTGFGPRHVAVGSVSVPRSLSLSLSLSRPPLSLPLALTQHPPSLSVPCQMSVFHLRRTIRRIRFRWRSQGDIVPKLYACVFVTVDEGGGCELYCCGDPKVPEAYIEPPSVPVA